jgi:hypothetical protein
MNNILHKYKIILIGIIILVAALFRFWLISGNNFVFYFDQSRDAFLSQQIFQDHKLKIQGPSASGTDDKIYHGVLYYYIIGPVYALSHGNPLPVLWELIIINVLTIIPLFYLTKAITNNSLKASFLAIIFFTFSYILVEFGIHLSNQIYFLPASTLFYYLLWKVFFDNKTKWFPLMMLCLGIAVQSGIYMLYLSGSIILAYYVNNNYHYSSSLLKKKKLLITGIIVFFLSISTLIATELLLFIRGILHLNDLSKFSNQSTDIMAALQTIASGYLTNISLIFFPSNLLLSFFISIIILYYASRHLPEKTKRFLFICVFSPLFLLVFQPRGGLSYLQSITPIIYSIISSALVIFWKQKNGNILIFFAILLFLFGNIATILRDKSRSYFLFSIQQGASLKDELAVIDYTYKTANGKSFTISTLTNPYGYNITWAYLYSWYGKQKYGYTPAFYGPDQTGLYGSGLIVQSPKPERIHFSIYEPLQGFSVPVRLTFIQDQNIFAGSVSSRMNFHEFTVERR